MDAVSYTHLDVYKRQVLIGNRPPAIGRAVIGQLFWLVNFGKPVEPPFRPRKFQARHHRNRAITRSGETADQRRSVGGQQILIIALIGDAHPGQQAGMRQPRPAAEGARLDPRRGDPPTSRRQFPLQRGKIGGQRRGEARIIDGQRPVGSVSYTYLDVYKRQGLNVAPGTAATGAHYTDCLPDCQSASLSLFACHIAVSYTHLDVYKRQL